MSAFTAVLLYAAWTLLLSISYAIFRVPMIARGTKGADHWERGKPIDDPPLLLRARNAHANCVENFAVFAAVVIIATLIGRTALVDALAGYVFFARIGQSLSHLAGTSMALIALRGTFHAIQVLTILYMIWRLLHG